MQQFIDQVVDIPVVQKRQGATEQTVQSTVLLPQAHVLNKVGKLRQCRAQIFNRMVVVEEEKGDDEEDYESKCHGKGSARR